MEGQLWRKTVCKKFSGTPRFQLAVCDIVEEAAYQVDWHGSLEVVAGRVWKLLAARGRYDVLAEIVGEPAAAEVNLDEAKLQVMEAVAVHRGERDAMGPRLSLYVDVPMVGWSDPVRVEILTWLADLATEIHVVGGGILRFRLLAASSRNCPTPVG